MKIELDNSPIPLCEVAPGHHFIFGGQRYIRTSFTERHPEIGAVSATSFKPVELDLSTKVIIALDTPGSFDRTPMTNINPGECFQQDKGGPYLIKTKAVTTPNNMTTVECLNPATGGFVNVLSDAMVIAKTAVLKIKD